MVAPDKPVRNRHGICPRRTKISLEANVAQRIKNIKKAEKQRQRYKTNKESAPTQRRDFRPRETKIVAATIPPTHAGYLKLDIPTNLRTEFVSRVGNDVKEAIDNHATTDTIHPGGGCIPRTQVCISEKDKNLPNICKDLSGFVSVWCNSVVQSQDNMTLSCSRCQNPMSRHVVSAVHACKMPQNCRLNAHIDDDGETLTGIVILPYSDWTGGSLRLYKSLATLSTKKKSCFHATSRTKFHHQLRDLIDVGLASGWDGALIDGCAYQHEVTAVVTGIRYSLILAFDKCPHTPSPPAASLR